MGALRESSDTAREEAEREAEVTADPASAQRKQLESLARVHELPPLDHPDYALLWV